MNQMTLAEYAKMHSQAKVANDFGLTQYAISKAISAGRQIMVTIKPDGTVTGEEIRPFPSNKKAAA